VGARAAERSLERAVRREAERLRLQEIWIGWVRLLAVAWAVAEVGFVAHDYPEGHERWAWVTTGVLAVGATLFLWAARGTWAPRTRAALGAAALVFDSAIIYAYVFIFAFEPGTPTWGLLSLIAIEAALRYAVVGGAGIPILLAPVLLVAEWWRSGNFAPTEFEPRYVTLPLGTQIVVGLIVGGLIGQLRDETRVAESRATEAEELKDEIGRRADRLEVVNRAARALSSSLELEEAFRLFVREVRSAVAFDRLALVLAERGRALVIANAGVDEGTLFPKGTWRPIEGTVLERIVADGEAVVRGDMDTSPLYPEERELAAAGLKSRVVAPLAVTGRNLGMISVSRIEADAFTRDDAELLTLLGRQLATAIENIRAFEAERSAAEELRRLSALRADFVSLVSHELRGPMASVVGCAATLRQRWRTLSAEQRESFLALIEEETSRLADLVGDVLDTSRLDAGTFTYSFSEVDIAEVVREVAAVVDLGQEDVDVHAEVDGHLPTVRADRERLRQLLMNLLTNAVKYTVAGDRVLVRAAAENGAVLVSVQDNGPGISREEQRVIFEKFGRASTTGGSKPGAGLGLFIARSIAEAHGGELEVDSEQGAGATFTVRLPTSA
jgi:signal transduction histidine kinase